MISRDVLYILETYGSQVGCTEQRVAELLDASAGETVLYLDKLIDMGLVVRGGDGRYFALGGTNARGLHGLKRERRNS